MPLTAAMLTFAFLTRLDLILEQGLKIAVGVLCRKPSIFANAVHYLSRNRRRSIHLHFKPIPLGIYFALFAVSGFAGLIYESIWSHYLKLFLGHAAYAQTLVLALFMGGMAIGAWIARSGVERVVLARHGVPEAFNQAARIVVTDLEPALEGLVDRLSAPVGVDTAWREAIDRAVGHARALAGAAAGREGSQGEAVRAAVEAIPEGGLLIVGNSMPVRDVDLYVPAEARGITVLSQRGAAGIDGLIAGAAGAAAATGRPTLLLLGDVSFQHDVGGLAAAARCKAPLAIVVVGNGGGRLFELLPLRSLPDVGPTFERYFLTPPGVDSVLAAQAFGVRGRGVAGGTAAREALRSSLAEPGATVIEVRVDPHGADETRRLAAEMDAWLGD